MKITAVRQRLAPAQKYCDEVSRYVFLDLNGSPTGLKCSSRIVAAAVLQAISDILAESQGLPVTSCPLINAAIEDPGSRLPFKLLETAKAALKPFHSSFRSSEDLGTSWESLVASVRVEHDADIRESNAKRDFGVYYTPKSLAVFLTEATLNSVVQNYRSARDLLDLLIVDPAVGAGFFLIAAHRFLLASAKTHTDAWKIKGLPAKIAQRCLYGVDRDPFAATVAKVALWLEVGDPQLAPEDLSHIRSGDALVSVHGSSTGGLALLGALKKTGFRPFEWRSGFPEVFGRDGRSGFDVVLSNPPWGKIKSDAREYFERLHPEVSTLQGAQRKAFLASPSVSAKTRESYSNAADALRKYVELLRTTPAYKPAFGISTDIDYYTLFVQRSVELLHRTGRLGLLIPGAFVRSAGTALIRRNFFQSGETEHLLEFENRERLFPIHGMFKFLIWTFSRGGKPGIRKAVFGLRSVDEARSEILAGRRTVSFSSAFLTRISKEWFSVPELYNDRQKQLFAKLHTIHPPLGEKATTWSVHFTRELDMTNDSESFIDASTKQAQQDQSLLPLYEGRMVNQFDCAAKGYISGHGRQAKWEVLQFEEKVIRPHYYVSNDALSLRKLRAGFCDITGNANERTVLAALIPETAVCGNKVPVCDFNSEDVRLHLLWIALANSFVIDWIVRRRISTTLNFFHWKQIPFPRLDPYSECGQELWTAAAKLSVIGSPKAPVNNGLCQLLLGVGVRPKQLSMLERAHIRAEIDARVALLFGLDATDLTYLLTDFGTLDRSQPGSRDLKKIPGHACTITRDFCLQRFFEMTAQDSTSVSLPWGGTEPVDLPYRVGVALASGCLPYVPSQLAAKMFR